MSGDSPYKSVADLTVYLKQQGDKASYASVANTGIVSSELDWRLTRPGAAGIKGTGSGDCRVYGRDGALAWTSTRRYAAHTSLIGNYRHVV